MERKLSRYIIAESTYASSEALNSRDICSIQRENSAIQHVPSTCNTSCLSRFQPDAGFFRLSETNLIQLATFRKFWTMQTRNVVHSQEASTEEEAASNLLVVHPPVHCKRLDLLYHWGFADDYFNKWITNWPAVVEGEFREASSEKLDVSVLAENVEHSDCVHRWIHVAEVELVRWKLETCRSYSKHEAISKNTS